MARLNSPQAASECCEAD